MTEAPREAVDYGMKIMDCGRRASRYAGNAATAVNSCEAIFPFVE